MNSIRTIRLRRWLRRPTAMPHSPPSTPDGMLVARVRAGERAAFAEIVERYQPALLHAASSRLGRADLAEDAVQEAFLCAFKWLGSYDSQYSFRTWLWTILLNQCTRIGQKQARNDLRADAATAARAEVASSEASPVELLLRRERALQLHALLARLPEAQADALRLRFFGELKFQEIADALGISESGAKNRVKLALMQLSAWLQAESLAVSGRGEVGDRS